LTIRIFTTGGTFDKLYFDAESEFPIGDPIAKNRPQSRFEPTGR